MRRRKLTPLLLSLAITVGIGSTVAWSGTQESALLTRIAAGDGAARLDLAQFYEAQDQRERAIAQLEAAAGEGNVTAHILLAEHYARSSDGELWAKAKAHAQLAQAAEGADQLERRLGIIAATRAIDLSRPAVERAAYARDGAAFLKRAASNGDAEAKWHLGYLHVMLHVDAPDPAAGMAMIYAAADAGNSVAAYWLAKLYEGVVLTGNPTRGMSVPTLDVKAYARQQSFHYLQQAAMYGNRLAAEELAGRYAQGDAPGGVDVARANRILAHLDTAPGAEVDTLALQPETHQPPMPRMINASFTTAAPAAQGSLNEDVVDSGGTAALQEQIGIHEATIASLRQQLDAANAKIVQLEAQLAEVAKYRALMASATELNERGLRLYLAGDHEGSLPLFRRASELNHSGATANLAMHYLNGYAVPQDLRQAQALLVRASEAGNLVATENLAELYETGAGLAKDPSRAISWYRRAQLLGSAKATAALDRLGAGPHP